jgi:hypothetical protein
MPDEMATSGRDPQTGLFQRGNQIGKGVGGNPSAKRMKELKQALIDCGTEADVQALYKSLLSAAKDGDVQAARLLLDHLVGKPAQTTILESDGGKTIFEIIHTLTRPQNDDDSDHGPRITPCSEDRLKLDPPV